MALKLSADDLAFLKKQKIHISTSDSTVKLPEAPFGLEMNTQHDMQGVMPLGAYSYAHGYSRMVKRVGRYCSLGQDLRVVQNTHPTDRASTSPVFYSLRRYGQSGGDASKKHHVVPFNSDWVGVTIGHDVWIGDQVTIMDGVNIGNGAIVAFGSVVTRDVPDFHVVAGMPARTVSKRFADDGLIAAFSEVKWWRFAISDLIERSPEVPHRFAQNLGEAIARGEIHERVEQRVTLRQLLRQRR